MKKSREVREAPERLKDLVKKRQEKLLEPYEVQCFFRNTDKAVSKHEALERALTALDEKIVQLGDDTKALAQKHPESQDTIQGKYDALITTWEKLKDYMKTLISADDLAKDVAGAEAQVERHKEYTSEINSRGDSFDTCMQEDTKLSTLERERASLMQLCEERREQLEKCVGLQYFYSDAEQSESWIAQEEKMRHPDEFVTKLIESNHCAAVQVYEIQEGLQNRRNVLKKKAQNRRQHLEDSHRYQMFDRDADEMQT
ncbi:unnamed protein product [Trichobilharzia regenti]|nr:unnamed protein product [Trichobilharzia regenti]